MAGVCNGNKLLPCSHLLNFIFVVLLLLIGNVLPYIVQLGSPTSLPATESRLTTHTHSVAAQLATVWSIWTSVYGFPATHFVMHCFLLNVPRLRCRSAGNAGWSVWTYFFVFPHSNPISVMFSLPPFFLHYFVEVRSLCAPTFVATLQAQGD